MKTIKTYFVATALLVFFFTLSILNETGILFDIPHGTISLSGLLASSLINSTAKLPLFLVEIGISKTFAALFGFLAWFVYAVGFFQCTMVRIFGFED
jgi:hypothetical protein